MLKETKPSNQLVMRLAVAKMGLNNISEQAHQALWTEIKRSISVDDP